MGPITSLAFVLTIGDVSRFEHSNQVSSYLGLIPSEHTSGGKQYAARCHYKPKGVAKVAAARKLAVRLYWMLRRNVGYPEIVLIESSSRVPLVGLSQTEGLIGRSRIQH